MRSLTHDLDERIDDLLTESAACPMCGVYNLPWNDLAEALEIFETPPDPVAPRGQTWDLPGGRKVTHGTACWDADFGDECGACLQTVMNLETCLCPPGGMGHDWPE